MANGAVFARDVALADALPKVIVIVFRQAAEAFGAISIGGAWDEMRVRISARDARHDEERAERFH